MRWMHIVLCLLLLVGVCFQMGCDGPCARACQSGERRCSLDGLLICTVDLSSGCHTWGLLPCPYGQRCSNVEGEHQCTSAKATPEECKANPYFVKRCVGQDVYWFDACGQQRSYWATCSTQTTCVNGDCQQQNNPSNDCQAGQQLCFAGTRRCVGTSFQICETDTTKNCTRWGASQTCPSGQYCVEGTCRTSPSNCQNACQPGQKQCVGNALQVCEANQVTGCLVWSNVQNCPAGQYCQGGACQSAPSNCQNPCQAGAAQCNGVQIQFCQADAKGCLVWTTPATCPTGQTCVSGRCQTQQGQCTDQCQSGAKQCAGAALQTCVKGASGCWEWGQPAACPTGQSCSNGSCQGGSSCQDQCKEGENRCQGVEAQNCQRQGQCTRWVRTKLCGANQDCKQENGAASCVCRAGFKPSADGSSCEPDQSTQLDCGMNAEEKRVHEIVNQERAKQGLSPLKCHANIVRESREWSKKQCARGYIGHDGASGRIQATGLSWSTWGENVAAGQRTPEDVMVSWMNSPGHRANILKSAFSHLGVGFYNCGKGYKYYWTQLFMKLR